MRKLTTMLLLLVIAVTASAQNAQIAHIRKMYAQVKEQVAQNGKDGMAPLDMTISTHEVTKVDDDFFIDFDDQLTFYFTKYRIDSSLDYPDASSCYFIVGNSSANGHSSYREILFDPNEGYLLFSYMRAETHAGMVIESRYYYDADGKLIEQKHKVGGDDATPDAQSWSDAEGDKKMAMKYLDIFNCMLNTGQYHGADHLKASKGAPDAEQMKYIRSQYAEAKAKITRNSQAEENQSMQIVIRDQTWGPPQITEVNYYYTGDGCYFIADRRHHNNMGSDTSSEYLLAPKSSDLLFSYTCSKEEGEKYEWRYYFNKKGQCIEVKSNIDDQDYGLGDKVAAYRYMQVYKALRDSQ